MFDLLGMDLTARINILGSMIFTYLKRNVDEETAKAFAEYMDNISIIANSPKRNTK